MDKKVCIFCASSTRVPDVYHHAAKNLATLLVQQGHEIVYGAGSVGLMGTIAEAALENKGEITGIIPRFMVDMNWANNNLKKLVVVNDMWERKKVMIENATAIIALAGGIGTLDELVEVITLKQLGQFTKPVIILNTNNFYAPLLEQLKKMVTEGFMRESHTKLWHLAQTPEEVLQALSSLKEIDRDVINAAQV